MDKNKIGALFILLGALACMMIAGCDLLSGANPPVVPPFSRTTFELNSGFVFGRIADPTGIQEVQYDAGDGWKTAAGKETWNFKAPSTKDWPLGSVHTVAVRARNAAGEWVTQPDLKVKVGVNKDFNGDGFADAIVGAEEFYLGGRAYIYFGGTDMSVTANVTLDAFDDHDHFGCSVASAGDVNGDGYADVIVGAHEAEGGGTGCGQAYIFFGGPNMDSMADVTMSGIDEDCQFGYSVASAGDVNKDGYADVIVGAYQADTGGTNKGQAFIYFGGPGMMGTVTPNVTLTGSKNGCRYGYSVASAGDMNGDGYADVIVGEPGPIPANLDPGRASIYLGSGSMDDIADLTLDAPVVESMFGYSVASAGDVNGDGCSDVIVGGPYPGAAGTYARQAYLFLGGKTMNSGWDLSFSGSGGAYYFGNSVASAGDVNGDGFADVIVSEIWAEGGGTRRGQVYVFFGGPGTPGMNGVADVTMSGATNLHYLGSSVASAGDLNGDGFADVIVGAVDVSVGYDESAYVYFGGLSTDAQADRKMKGDPGQDLFGVSVD